LYEHRWLQPNVGFLRTFLAAGRVSDALDRAAASLAGQPEQPVAAQIRQDLPLCMETLKSHCNQLSLMLEKTRLSGRLAWSK